jgi:hypothetical protein
METIFVTKVSAMYFLLFFTKQGEIPGREGL